MSLHQQGQLAEAGALVPAGAGGEAPIARPRYLLAVLFYQQQRLAEAAGAVEAALRLNPDGLESRLLKGVLAQAAGRGEEAAENFAAVTARQPGLAEDLGTIRAWCWRGWAAIQRRLPPLDRDPGPIRPRPPPGPIAACSLRTLGRIPGRAGKFRPGAARWSPRLSRRALQSGRCAVGCPAFRRSRLGLRCECCCRRPDAFLAWNNRGAALHGLGPVRGRAGKL